MNENNRTLFFCQNFSYKESMFMFIDSKDYKKYSIEMIIIRKILMFIDFKDYKKYSIEIIIIRKSS